MHRRTIFLVHFRRRFHATTMEFHRRERRLFPIIRHLHYQRTVKLHRRPTSISGATMSLCGRAKIGTVPTVGLDLVIRVEAVISIAAIDDKEEDDDVWNITNNDERDVSAFF
jgi:hypothetical protein